MELAVFIIYALALAFIFCFSIVQLNLTYVYLREKKKKNAEASIDQNKDWPMVTVQLPVYNELYVIERLIEAVIAFDYPKERLEIQVLDDSTDETRDIILDKVAAIKKDRPEINIEAIHRPTRIGFKAGALAYGTALAKGEFIAIFDADFLPTPDFLKRTISAFTNERIGVVQTRWGHINRDYSMLTQLQAFALDAHFTVEQTGRSGGGHFINFNGTGGVWRKVCIEDAGGWKPDTLTEDLDLSYRAQLKGWKFSYLEELESPAELPATMNALKSQQFRWTKGAAETARKNLGNVLRAKLPFSTKLHSTFHLLNSGVFVCVLLTALLSIPVLIIKNRTTIIPGEILQYSTFFLLSLVTLSSFYWVSFTKEKNKGFMNFLRFAGTFPIFLSVSMGLSLHNGIAVIEGYLGYKTPFIRTPKFNITTAKDSWKTNKYVTTKISPLTLLEGLFVLYFIAGILLGLHFRDYAFLVFHSMLVVGFGAVFFYSVKHARIT